jgi:hypothetical protein
LRTLERAHSQHMLFLAFYVTSGETVAGVFKTCGCPNCKFSRCQ